MTTKPQTASAVGQQRVLDALAEGMLTWQELSNSTGLNEERLGLALAELFERRRVWTRERGETRVYGLERRVSFWRDTSTPRRRESDHV